MDAYSGAYCPAINGRGGEGRVGSGGGGAEDRGGWDGRRVLPSPPSPRAQQLQQQLQYDQQQLLHFPLPPPPQQQVKILTSQLATRFATEDKCSATPIRPAATTAFSIAAATAAAARS